LVPKLQIRGKKIKFVYLHTSLNSRVLFVARKTITCPYIGNAISGITIQTL
jgi:hypothetical protein